MQIFATNLRREWVKFVPSLLQRLGYSLQNTAILCHAVTSLIFTVFPLDVQYIQYRMYSGTV